MQRQTRPDAEAAGASSGPTPGQGDTARGGPGFSPPSDDALLAAVARADREALGALYDRHAPLLLGLALRLLGDRVASDEALHDVFVEVWHHARDFDATRGSVRTWLIGRMRTLALARRAVLPADEAGLRGGIAGLPADLAAVLELTYFAGLPVAITGERLGIPAELVKDRLGRALSLLRQRVSPPEEGTS